MAGSIWVVMVNYRTASLAIDCLRSLAPQVAGLPHFHTVIVDNASGDGSARTLAETIARDGWHEWASVLPLDRNGGFSSGINAAIAQALVAAPRVEYLVFLNPDTVLHRDAVRALVDFMERHPRAGIAGSRLENTQGSPECSAHRAPSPIGELVSAARLGLLNRALRRYVVTLSMPDAAQECDWVSGASFIVRRQVLHDIGGFDEGYFLYFEEVDFCLRARKAGWQVWFVPESRVTHLEGASTGIRDRQHRRPKYWYDSRRRYFLTYFGVPGLIAADLLWVVGRASLVVRRALKLGSGGPDREPKWFGIDLLWNDLRSLFGGKLWGKS